MALHYTDRGPQNTSDIGPGSRNHGRPHIALIPVYVRDGYLTIMDYNSVPPRLEFYRRPLQHFRTSPYTIPSVALYNLC